VPETTTPGIPVIVPVYQRGGVVPLSPATWDEADRELAARQAEREQAHRERVVRELTVQAEALAEAVKAAQQAGSFLPAPATRARAQREDSAARKTQGRARPAARRSRRGAAPPADDLDGADPADPLRYDELYAGSDESADAFADDEAHSIEAGPLPAAADPERAGAAPIPAGKASSRRGVQRASRQRPAPLALWAHRQTGHHNGTRRAARAAGGTDAHQPTPGPCDLPELLKSLNIPLALAETGYTAGCRIRRIRVRRRKGPRPVEKNAPIVIISRRALERLRPAVVPRVPPEAAAARG
jgi:hypothetical protein